MGGFTTQSLSKAHRYDWGQILHDRVILGAMTGYCQCCTNGTLALTVNGKKPNGHRCAIDERRMHSAQHCGGMQSG